MCDVEVNAEDDELQILGPTTTEHRTRQLNGTVECPWAETAELDG